MKLISQGAEAKIYLVGREELSKSSKSCEKAIIVKSRMPKSYRHPLLDEKIRTRRTKSEAKLITKAKQLINTPEVLNHDKFNIEMQFIEGDKLSETLSQYPEKNQLKIMGVIGKHVAKLHSHDIIHGDLTTSNIILQTNKNQEKINNLQKKIFIIDFGLGFISHRIEDKAVDIHLIKEALEAKHFQNHEKLFKSFLKGYKFKESEKVLEQLKKVEARGRYKSLKQS